MQRSFASSQVNTTQVFSTPMAMPSPNHVIQSPVKQPAMAQALMPKTYEQEWKSLAYFRIFMTVVASLIIQFLVVMTFSLCTLNSSYLNPKTWFWEFFHITFSPLTLMNGLYIYFTYVQLSKERIYRPTRISKFMNSFGYDALIGVLNFFIGLFAARLFMRCLSDDYKHLTNKANELNESYSFFLIAGVLLRFFFSTKRDEINFPIAHQPRIQQLRMELATIVRTSFIKSLPATFRALMYFVLLGSSFSNFLRAIFFIEYKEAGLVSRFVGGFVTLYDVKLLIYAWIFSSMMFSYTQLMTRLSEIFSTQSKQFPISNSKELTIIKALEKKENRFMQHLAAQDLFLLADSANGLRRKEFYALSVPGSHPHNWKQLLAVVLTSIDNFTNELAINVDYVAKNRRNDATLNVLNNPIQKFYEHKHITRQQNETNGIRSFAPSSPVQLIAQDDKRSKFLLAAKQRLLRYKLVAFLFGEDESGKLNFLLSQNSQMIIWTTQGIAALVARSLDEDSYGVVQLDIKTIIKSFLKLRAALEKVSAINTIAKDRNLYALKAALRRSIYRITTNFSQYFEDMVIDAEDVRALHGFITFKEL